MEVVGVAVPVTSASAGAGQVTVATASPVRLMGWSVRESDTTAAVAEVVLRQGSTTGQIVAQAHVAANGSVETWMGPQGVICREGLFIDRIGGTTTVVVWVE
jgi:hypothetical protein